MFDRDVSLFGRKRPIPEYYPSFKAGHLNVSELARVCDLSRTTVYKYLSLLEN